MRATFIPRVWRSRSRYEKALFFLFLLTLPFLHLRVNGDGIGYYAYVRSPLIDHNFNFSSDWRDPGEELEKVFLVNHFVSNPVTKTGHLPNFYTVGPAILWSPFLIATHLAVLGLASMGWHVPPDGHSWPYVAAMAGATAFYAFAGLCLSFAIARKYVEERWAFWATVAMWFGTALPIFIWLLPAWSHAHSVFANSLFLWYWLRTRGTRTAGQWLLLGLLAGLMIDVYQLNGVFLLAVAYEAVSSYAQFWPARESGSQTPAKLFRLHALCALGVFVGLLPTFITRQIVFGNPFAVGPYTLRIWNWSSPFFLQVLFSSNHGLLVFAPILLPAIAGLYFFWRLDRAFGNICMLITLVFYFLIACFPWWHGAVGLGNRFFLSLTPIFVLGLASLFARTTRLWTDSAAAAFRLVPLTLLLVVWNLGLVYQWETHLFPRYGPVYWPEVIFNQFHVVPVQALHDLSERFHLHADPPN
ncbi:MAG TPA: hypothetical protein VEI73_10830 [Candidatus Acidoferrum sp.]|nr:hypothetical protein [Candidatus Acidoferrum sp.]